MSFDDTEYFEFTEDLNERIEAYILEDLGDEVIDYEIYQNGRGERCVAVALRDNDKVRGGVVLVRPAARYGNDVYSLTGIREDEGPLAFFCPQRILDMLSPTDSYDANYWREMCHERLLVESGELAPLPSFVIVDHSRDAPCKPMPENNGEDCTDDFNHGYGWKNESRCQGGANPDSSCERPLSLPQRLSRHQSWHVSCASVEKRVI